MKIQLPSKVTRVINGAGLRLKKHSPELLVISGVIGLVSAGIMACKATTELDDILEEHKQKSDDIHDAIEHPETLVKPYTEEESKKVIALLYAQTGLELVKLYAPSVIIGTLSATAILAGHNITRKRNVALAAAYTTVDSAFKDYRGRVVERFGEALDKELRYNIKSQEIEEIVQNEDGTTTVEKKVVNVSALDGYSDYCKFFCEGNPNWSKDPEWNFTFLRDQERYANNLLKSRGHLFLNEVYDMIGIDRTKAGQAVGWIFDEKCPNGDNYIDFGILDLHKEANHRFVNGYERNILLDFNVDGNIMDLI